MWDVREARPSIVEAADVIEAFSRLLRASAADRIERSWTRLEKDMVLIGADVRRQGRLDSQLQRTGEGGIKGWNCANVEDVQKSRGSQRCTKGYMYGGAILKDGDWRWRRRS